MPKIPSPVAVFDVVGDLGVPLRLHSPSSPASLYEKFYAPKIKILLLSIISSIRNTTAKGAKKIAHQGKLLNEILRPGKERRLPSWWCGNLLASPTKKRFTTGGHAVEQWLCVDPVYRPNIPPVTTLNELNYCLFACWKFPTLTAFDVALSLKRLAVRLVCHALFLPCSLSTSTALFAFFHSLSFSQTKWFPLFMHFSY